MTIEFDDQTTDTEYKSEEEQRILEYLNREFFVTYVNGMTPIVREGIDPNTGKPKITFVSPGDFDRLFLNRTTNLLNASQGTPVSRYWLQHKKRREYKGIVFDPAMKSPGYYNLFKGLTVKPIEGDCTMFLDFMREVICNHDQGAYDYLVAYLAHLVQCPGELPGAAIVLQGSEGTGKGTFARQVGALVNPYFTHFTEASSLTTRFNEALNNNLVVFADETSTAGDKAGMNLLKGYVTEPQLWVEQKYHPRYQIANYMRLFIASNDPHVIQASAGDRRFLVLAISNRRANDHAYFGQLVERMDNGGREALMHYLLNNSLAGVNLRSIPQTTGMHEQKLQSMSPEQRWWYDCLMRGELPEGDGKWPGWIAKFDVLDDYRTYVHEVGERTRADETKHGRFMRAMLGDALGTERRIIQNSMQRPHGYLLPSLQECRALFDKVMNMACDWPPVE